MPLEDLINKYHKNFLFKVRTKLEHYKKQIDVATKVTLLTTFGFMFYAHTQFNNKTISVIEEALCSQGAVKKKYEKCIEEGKVKGIEELALIHKHEYDYNINNFVMRKYSLGDWDWNMRFFPFVFYGMFGFLLLEDIFAKKKTKLTKNFTRFAFTFGGSYALLNMLDYKPISDCGFEEFYNKSLFAYNFSLLFTGLNYVTYNLFHGFAKKPVVLNFPKGFYNFINFLTTGKKESLKKSYSYLENSDLLFDFHNSLINLEKEVKFDDVSKTKQKLDLILDSKTEYFGNKKHLMNEAFLNLPFGLFLYRQKSQKVSRKLENFEFLYSINNYSQAFSELRSILDNKKYAYDFSIVYSILFEDFVNKINHDPKSLDLEGIIRFGNDLGDFNDAVKKTWDDTIQLILNDKRTLFSDVYGDRIKAIVSSEYLRKTLAFKKGELNELKDEKLLSEELEKLLVLEDRLSVARPITIVDLFNESYYVNEFSTGKNFMEVSDLEHYKRCVDLLKIMHSKIRTVLYIRDYRREVEERIMKWDPRKSNILEGNNWNYIWNFVTRSCSTVFDCDPHGEQMILSNDEIVRIDMEDKGLVEWPFQMNKLVIQSGMKGENYDRLVHRYCAGNNLFENIKAYLLATIPSALSYIARTYEDDEKIKQREIYLGCAIKACDELGLEDIKKEIKKIKI